MRRRLFLLLWAVFGLAGGVSAATREICGDPPPAQFREENNEAIKGDLTGKANLLTRFVGNAELGGKIESTRKEVFAKYPDANAAYMDRYLAYMFCYVLFDPNNKQSTEDKLKAIQEFRIRQQRAHTTPSVDIGGKWRTMVLINPYDENERSILILEFTQAEDTIYGTVTEMDPDGTYSSASSIVDGKIKDNILSFYTQGEVYWGDVTRPYKESYVGVLSDKKHEIVFKRVDDLPNGGIPEKFIARRN
jgi:hypothetical protein